MHMCDIKIKFEVNYDIICKQKSIDMILQKLIYKSSLHFQNLFGSKW